jgi:hypothetical protein
MMSGAMTLLSEVKEAFRNARRERRDEGARPVHCAACAYFRDDAEFIEANMPGLTSMGSGHASVRARDGICLRLDRYLSGDGLCGHFAAIGGASGIGCPPI